MQMERGTREGGRDGENTTWALVNKPDRAKMRPDCVSACVDHVTYMERHMDEQMGEMTKQ